jgi:hypothetical protein
MAEKSNYKPLKDPSLLAVIIGNVVSLFLAFIQGWDLGDLMWVFWGQSVIIGITNFIRMWTLKEFTTKGMTMNDQPVPETASGKRSVAIFFAFHYGFFHLGYFVFLWAEKPLDEIPVMEMAALLLAVSTFVGTHSFSLLHNAKMDFREKKPNLGTLMFYPYMRIIPMHLAIIFGHALASGAAMLLFLGLKIGADIGMHITEHHLFQRIDREEDTPIIKN